ncbi:hypothetical protein [Paenibacillus piri]|uniref:Uncharacterized protein n=1 Tax=Paenibacillus piri TaxID=2547395 RepID=A0A4R5KGJ0_9BACL|nr:hypothetical protein [Paenibacillus piri]TDF94142.1 hypothetical protein E1757_24955 [Paenibacillus piri]
MKIEWFLFEHSYLLGIEFNPIGCSLTLIIDAKITFEHPQSTEMSNTEENYEKIAILFEGVQYLRMINSLQLLSNPNEDFGSIEQLKLKSPDSISQGLSISENENRRVLSLELSKANVATVFSISKNLSFINFVSEMISFELGFERYSIVVSE